jgi:hypothetical protein
MRCGNLCCNSSSRDILEVEESCCVGAAPSVYGMRGFEGVQAELTMLERWASVWVEIAGGWLRFCLRKRLR